MKSLPPIAAALLLAHAACRVVPFVQQEYVATNITTLTKVFGTPLDVRDNPVFDGDSFLPAKRTKSYQPDTPTPAESGQPAASPQSEWEYYVCRGEKLTRASKLDKDKAESFVLPIDTQFKGALKAERKLWGYTESPFPDCDIEGDYYDIRRAYEKLNIHDEDTQCFRVFHYDPEKVDDHGNDIDLVDQTFKVGDKVFRATGAHGTFGINVNEGAVLYIDVASASLKAAELWGVDKPAKDQLPALRQMSDLSWAFVINDITLRLIDNALKTYAVPDGEERIAAVPEWPGITFDVETEAGKALLGKSSAPSSPNGIAAAYFLSQHKQEIGGNKYVQKITVFRPDDDADSDEPALAYYVEDAPETSSEDENSENPERNQGLTTRDLVLTAKTNVWHDYVCCGEKLTLACKNNKDKAVEFAEPIDSPWEGTMEAELKLWGYREEPADSHCDFSDIETALKGLKIGVLSMMEGGNNHCYQVRRSYGDGTKTKVQTYDANGKKFRMTDSYSIIGANAISGTIFCVDVKSAYHAAEELWYPEVPTVEKLPGLRTISDISWAIWNRVQLKRPPNRQNLGNINYFVVHNIVNRETLELIKQSLKIYDLVKGQQRVTELPRWPGLTFRVESEAGQAMLGSPNGIAAGYFLSQHKNRIGSNRYVYQVQIFASDLDSGPSMILHVKDAPPPTPDNAKSQEKRDGNTCLARRGLHLGANSGSFSKDVTMLSGVNDEEFWSKYVCRGEKLAQASIRNKDTAINFVTPIDSEFDGTMEAELKIWGYTDHRGVSMYCDLDNVASNLDSIGVDAKFKKRSKSGQNERFHIEHGRSSDSRPIRDQTYEVDDKPYRMTGAWSHIGVNARDGVVTFFNVRSAERGAIDTWKVDKPAETELPRLRRISDITWAFWNRAHNNDVDLNNINKFLVHDVVNEDTIKLMKMALKSYQVPEGQQRYTNLPKWPGLEFDIETPEGKAMLGSPNGVAAGYFLAQHKDQLGGNKYIHKATIWKDSDGDEQMLYWVKDAQALPEGVGQGMGGDSMPYRDGAMTGLGNAADKIVKRSVDSRNFIREHRVLERL